MDWSYIIGILIGLIIVRKITNWYNKRKNPVKNYKYGEFELVIYIPPEIIDKLRNPSLNSPEEIAESGIPDKELNKHK